MRTALQGCLRDAFAHSQALRRRDSYRELADGFPVLWFGKLDAWLKKSNRPRIMTVGVNPGPSTFAPPAPTDVAAPWWGALREDSAPSLEDYSKALSTYWDTRTTRPKDRSWFGSYDPILRALGVTDPLSTARVIHTDVFSPIATKVTWRDLDDHREFRDSLREFGIPLWLRLVCVLRPDVVVISVNKAQWREVESLLEGVRSLGSDIDARGAESR